MILMLLWVDNGRRGVRYNSFVWETRGMCTTYQYCQRAVKVTVSITDLILVGRKEVVNVGV